MQKKFLLSTAILPTAVTILSLFYPLLSLFYPLLSLCCHYSTHCCHYSTHCCHYSTHCCHCSVTILPTAVTVLSLFYPLLSLFYPLLSLFYPLLSLFYPLLSLFCHYSTLCCHCSVTILPTAVTILETSEKSSSHLYHGLPLLLFSCPSSLQCRLFQFIVPHNIAIYFSFWGFTKLHHQFCCSDITGRNLAQFLYYFILLSLLKNLFKSLPSLIHLLFLLDSSVSCSQGTNLVISQSSQRKMRLTCLKLK